jgi:hypothetical protein
MHDLPSNVISKRNLKYMGKRASRLRQEFDHRAQQLSPREAESLDEALAKTSKLSNYVRSRGTKKPFDPNAL